MSLVIQGLYGIIQSSVSFIVLLVVPVGIQIDAQPDSGSEGECAVSVPV